MTLDQFKKKLSDYNVPDGWYSLDDGLKHDAFNLYRNYSNRECFYMDEKGDQRALRVFDNDEEAYDYLWQMIEADLRIFSNKPKNELKTNR